MKKLWIVILSGLLVTLGAGIAQAQNGYDLFQKALAKERAEGNIREAIQLYQRIVREHAANRALAATALVAMGQCYEKLGKAEARRAYERVVREYADQQEQATEARARLAALTPTAGAGNGSAMMARRVYTGLELDAINSLSPDGRYLFYVDWETGDLAVRDLSNGEKRRLTNKGAWRESPEFAMYSAVSPDGKQIAYAWSAKERVFDLRVGRLDGGPDSFKPRVLYRNENEEVEYLHPEEWSPDGKHILVVLRRRDRTHQVALVSAADGSARILKTLDWRAPGEMSFSRDGRHIAYDFPQKEEARDRDIFLLAVDGSREVPLVQHPAHDTLAGWTPDGKKLLFYSDRGGSNGLWLISVTDEKPLGSPELVKPDLGWTIPLGFSRKGSFFYIAQPSVRDVYTAALDPGTGKVISPPTASSDRKGRYGVYRVDAQSGATSPIVHVGERGFIHQAFWSAGGEAIFYATNGGHIVRRELETGHEKELLRAKTPLRGIRLALSPDGRRLAFVAKNDAAASVTLSVMPAAGGESRELLRLPEADSIMSVAWMRDARHLLFIRAAKQASSAQRKVALWRIGSDGGQPQKLELALDAMNQLRIHPDGRRIAFSAGEWKQELWMMENFLPVLRAAK